MKKTATTTMPMELSDGASLVGIVLVAQFLLLSGNGDFNSKGFNVWHRLTVIAVLSGVATVFN